MTTQDIVKKVERFYGLPPGAIMISTRGTRIVSQSRQLAMWLRYVTDPAAVPCWAQIGREFERSPGTVRHAVNLVRTRRLDQASGLRRHLGLF